MIKPTVNIVRMLKSVWVLLFLIVINSSCNNSKKSTEQSIFNQRKPFKELFHEANSEKMIGHDEKAITLFEQCLTIEPENPAVHFALSELYLSQGNKDKSYAYAETAYSGNPTNKWYALHLADLCYAREEYVRTADLYAKIIPEEKNIELKYKYVDVLMKVNRLVDAIKIINEIEVETGKQPELTFTKYDLFLQLGKPIDAQRELDAFLDENPSDPEPKIIVAEFYLDQRKFDEAQSLIESVIKTNPTGGDAYILLADLNLRKNDLTLAFNHLRIAFADEDVLMERKLDIIRGLIPYTEKNQADHEIMSKGVQSLFDIIYDPSLSNDLLHEAYGFFCLGQNELDKSAEQLQIACSINPSNFNTWLQLLSLQNQLDQYEALYSNGKQASELFPAQPILYLLTGIGAKETKNYSDAEERFFLGKDLVVQDPQLSSELLYQLGDLNYRQGNFETAESFYDQAISKNKGNINVYADRAIHLMKNNELEKAEMEISKGLEAAPKNSKLNDINGQILFLKKDYTAAAAAFLEALYDNYTDPVLLERCGDAYYLMGEVEKGIELWNESLKNGNTSPVLNRKLTDKKYYPSE